MPYINTLHIDKIAVKLGLGTRNTNTEENTRVIFTVVVVGNTDEIRVYRTVSHAKMLQLVKLCISGGKQYYVYRKPI